MLACSGQGEPEGANKNRFFRWAGLKRNKGRGGSPSPGRKAEEKDSHTSHRRERKIDSSEISAPMRRERIEEAKRKKLNGDYHSQEVYQKIADRLMDLFGI
jgi:hypothetical protein